MKTITKNLLVTLTAFSIVFSGLPFCSMTNEAYAVSGPLDKSISVELTNDSGQASAATVTKGDKSDKETAQEAVDEFIDNRKQDESGEFAYDRFADPKAVVKDVRVIEPAGNTDSCEASVVFDGSEHETGSGYLKTEIISVGKNGSGQVEESDTTKSGSVVSAEIDKDRVLLAASVLYSTNSVDPAELAAQKKMRELIANYVDIDYYSGNSYDSIMTASQIQTMEALAREATKGCTTDYAKIKAVYTFLGTHFFYCNTLERGGSPYKIWSRKYGACAEYSVLAEYLLDKSGIPCIDIASHSPEIGDQIGHAHNAAYDRQNKRWIYFDATWGTANDYDGSYWSTLYTSNGYKKSKSWFVSDYCNYDYFDMSAELAASLTYHAIRDVKYFTDGDECFTLNIPGSVTTDGGGAKWRDISNWSFAASKITNKNTEEFCIRNDLCGVPVNYVGSVLSELKEPDTLYRIIIPASISKIGSQAFRSEKRVDVILLGDPPTNSISSFYAMKYGSTITYPCTNPKWTDSVVSSFTRSTGTKWIKGHNITDPEIIVDATEIQDGYTECRCTLCGEVFRETIPATGDSDDDPDDDTLIAHDVDDSDDSDGPEILEDTDDPVTYEDELLDNPIELSAKTKTIKYKTIKKKAVKYSPIKVKNAVGIITYSAYSGNKKQLKINAKTGKITVKKGLKKGTYTLTVKVKSSGEYPYRKGYEYVKVKVKIVK